MKTSFYKTLRLSHSLYGWLPGSALGDNRTAAESPRFQQALNPGRVQLLLKIGVAESNRSTNLSDRNPGAAIGVIGQLKAFNLRVAFEKVLNALPQLACAVSVDNPKRP